MSLLLSVHADGSTCPLRRLRVLHVYRHKIQYPSCVEDVVLHRADRATETQPRNLLCVYKYKTSRVMQLFQHFDAHRFNVQYQYTCSNLTLYLSHFFRMAMVKYLRPPGRVHNSFQYSL